MTRVLGLREGLPKEHPRIDPIFHKWFCNELMVPVSTLFLLPRDHTKSTTGAVCDTIREVLIDPNVSVMIGSKTLLRSQKILEEIRQHLENPTLTFLFPDILWKDPGLAAKRRETVWTNDGIRVKRSIIRSDDTVWVIGIGKSITGFHPDIIVLDDIINEETVATEVQSNKVGTWWNYLQPIASARCRFKIYGTRYDALDLYGGLIAAIERGDIKMRLVQRSAKENGQFIYAFYDEELLQQKLKDLGGNTYVWMCQYFNIVQQEYERIFRVDYSTYAQIPIKREKCEAYCTIDPGFSTKTKRDYTGIVVVLYDPENHGWVELAKRYRLTVPELLAKMYDLDDEFHFDFLGVEAGAWQAALKQMFEYIVSSEGRRYLPIEPIHTPNTADAKHRRITQAAGFVNRQILSFRVDPEGEIDYTGDCATEMYYYSSNSRQHDDVVDALSMQQLVHIWGDTEPIQKPMEKPKTPEEELEDWRKKYDTYKHALDRKRARNSQRSWADF